MPQFPPIPPWDSLHPVVVHFPIVLLFLSPLFVLIGAILSPSKARPYMIAALIILALGTASLFVAAESGEAAAALADRNDAVNAVLAAHEDLASRTEVIFSVLSVVLLGIVVLPAFLHCQETRLTTTFMPLSFLVLYCVGILFVINTAHAGARLVHQYGIHAMIPAPCAQSSASPTAANPAPMAERR
jgi:uncharacterized membrane protein